MTQRFPWENPEHYDDCNGKYDRDGKCSCDYRDEDARDRAIQSQIDRERDK